jgi:hypothetical protein
MTVSEQDKAQAVERAALLLGCLQRRFERSYDEALTW